MRLKRAASAVVAAAISLSLFPAAITANAATKASGTVWADDVANHQGSSGNTESVNFGYFKNTDTNIQKFFTDAADGEAIGELKHINGIDNASNKVWNGYVEASVQAEKESNYIIYVLCDTSQNNRTLEVTNTTNNTGQSQSTNATEYSTTANLKVLTYSLRLAQGSNILKLQAASGTSGPNFIALYAEPVETSYEGALDMSDYYVTSYSSPTNSNPGYAFDKNDRTIWTTNRNGGYKVAYMVFYAGEGKTFDISSIKTVSNTTAAVNYYGTNNSNIMFLPSVTKETVSDISQRFDSVYGLTELCKATTAENGSKYTAENTVSGKYRYIVACAYNWPTTYISEMYFNGEVVADTEPVTVKTDTKLGAADAYSLPADMNGSRKTVSSMVTFEPLGLTKDASSTFIDCAGLTSAKPAVYKVNAASAGTYTAYVLGNVKNNGVFGIKTNGSTAAMKKEGSVDDNTALYSAEVSLNEGVNTIELAGDGALDGLYVSSAKQTITADAYNDIEIYSIRGKVMARYTAWYNAKDVTVKLTDGTNTQTAAADGTGTIEIDKLSGSRTYTAQLVDTNNTVLAAKSITAADSSFAPLDSVKLTNDGSAPPKGALGEYALYDSADVGIDYVLSLNEYKLLYPAFETAGLTGSSECKATGSYAGWEKLGIKGHTLGHYLSALSVFYASTPDAAKKAQCLTKIRNIVNALDYIQKNSKYMDPSNAGYNGGLDEGYIGGIDPAPFNKGFLGTQNTPGFPGDYNNVWAPWYNVHKTYQGLIDVYLNIKDTDPATAAAALRVCEKFSDWAVNGLDMMSDDAVQIMLDGEFGGMGDTMYELFDITGNYDYLRTADRFTHESIIDPLAAENDLLSLPENTAHDEHANTQIPKVNGIAGIYLSDPTRTEYKTAAEFFWNRVTGYRSYVFGGNSIEEFFEPLGDETQGAHSAESCNTHNMLLLTQRIFGWDHDSKYMDYYENALYNHIIGTQDPHTGGKSYFTSTLSGGHRTFSTTETSFWCCTGTGMENPGRYGEAIYYKDGQDLYVNLFVNSTLDMSDIKISQTTKFPYEDTTKITVTEGSANIKIRVPSWTKNMTVKRNGGTAEKVTADSKGYCTVSNCSAGDEITVVMPMELSTYHNKADDTTVAFKYGPILLGTSLGAYDGCIQNDQQADASKKTVDAPKLKAGASDTDVNTLLAAKDAASLTFTISGDYTSDGKAYDMVPFFNISTDSYNMYWQTEKAETAYLKNEVGPFSVDDVDLSNADSNILNVHFGVVRKSDTAASAFGYKLNRSVGGRYVGGMDKGYITKTVTIPKSGKYTAYVLCATNTITGGNSTARTVQVYVDDKDCGYTALAESQKYADRDLARQIAAYIVPVDCGTITAGEHTIKIASAADTYGANFAGFALYGTEIEEPIPAALTQTAFSGELDGAEISADGKTITKGDETLSVWKGEFTNSGLSGDKIKITANDGKAEKGTEMAIPTISGNTNVLFYVLVNRAELDSITYVIE